MTRMKVFWKYKAYGISDVFICDFSMHLKPGFPMVVTVVKIKSRSFSSAEIQHFRTENTRSVIMTREYL